MQGTAGSAGATGAAAAVRFEVLNAVRRRHGAARVSRAVAQAPRHAAGPRRRRLYTGNDFSNALEIADFFSKRHIKPRDHDYTAPLDAARERWPALVPQGFNQACQFRYWPGDDEVALAATLDDIVEISALCAGIDARLLVVILPSLPDVQPDTDRQTVDAIMATLHLGADDFGINLRLGRRLAASLAQRSIACLDPTDAMRAEQTPLYWRTDHHLDVPATPCSRG